MMPFTLKQIIEPTSMPDLAEFITTSEAASRLGFHVIYVRAMIRDGKLDGIKIAGKTWLISRNSVDRYLKITSGMEKHDPRRGKN
jgi:excisionase family DNA binding protein